MNKEILSIPDRTKEWLFSYDSLKLLAGQLATGACQGYPSQEQRLVREYEACSQNGDIITIPRGPWETQLSSEVWPTEEEQAELKSMGLPLDQLGRPLHPWFDSMLDNPRVGIVSGKGRFWEWGPNDTADPIIIRRDLDEPHVLLITRQDTKQWALPGGFVDGCEESVETAMREAYEETGLDIENLEPQVRELYWGPVADIRMTAHAWPNTSAYAFELSNKSVEDLPIGPYEAGDDAELAMWLPASHVGNEFLYGSHSLLIKMAFEG